MNSISIFGWVEQILGAIIILLVLTDVFMTVLYARIGTGLLSDRIAAGAWRTFKTVSKLFGGQRGEALSFCGPTILVMILFVWSFGLTLGAGLIIHPHLGGAIRATSGPTTHDFASAMYAAAASTSILGGSEFTPKTALFRLFFVFNSLVGLSTISLTLTYLMQIYSTLRQRNTLGLKFYLLSGETGDAAELLARLGAGGWFQSSYATIADLAAEMARLKESHHFYPVIFYFRFREPFYSMSKTTELAFETCTLIKTGLSDEKYRWLKNGAAVLALERSTLMLVKLLEHVFLVGRTPEPGEPPNELTRVRWHERYEGALQRMRAAGIETTADATAGVRAYVELRQQWEPYVQKLIRAGAFRLDEIEREVAQQN